jgi:MFS family permease
VKTITDLSSVLLVNVGLKEDLLSYYFLTKALLIMMSGLFLPKLLDSLGKRVSLYLMITMLSLSFYLLSLKNLYLFVIFSLFIYVINYYWGTFYNALVNETIPTKFRASTLSGMSLIDSLLMLPSSAIGAFLYQHFGWLSFRIFAIYSFIISLIILISFNKKIKSKF